MRKDRFAGEHGGDGAGIAAHERAVAAVLAHRPEGGAALAEALAADPAMVAAHALKGFGQVLLGRCETVEASSHALSAARNAAEVRGSATEHEQALVDALGLASSGAMLAAAARLEARLHDAPHDLLAFKIAHALRFMSGDQDGMLQASTAVLDGWSPDVAGFGFVLGCHAFGLEEAGRYGEAEECGREAVRREPGDAWGLHAVSHVHEMQNRAGDGIVWLEEQRPAWSRCNNFAFHVAWHLALFHVEQGRPDKALSVYDAEIRPAPTDDYRDMANAVSLLWRLRQEGVDGGGRWQELAAIAGRRRDDQTLVFASLHYLLALVAAGRLSAAADLVLSMESSAMHAAGPDQSGVASRVGADLARVIAGLRGTSPVRLQQILARLPEIGGSNAQRDVFVRAIGLAAAEAGDREAVEAVRTARRTLKAEDRFSRMLAARLEQDRARLCVA
jgi:tetratricopeptide (TPR) repeat protein